MSNNYVSEILITEAEIIARCKQMADVINHRYHNSKKLIILGLLKGSVPFVSQLIKGIDVLHDVEFMIVSSYQKQATSSGKVNILFDLDFDIKGYDIVVVDDIIDTGLTLSSLTKTLQARSPRSLYTVALLDKKAARTVSFEPDQIGFEVPNCYLVGYGLDIKGKFRHLPFIGVFNMKKFKQL